MADAWPKKTGDSIPYVQIKGDGVAEGYYWIKLPVTDKRALILGDITDCCQSIGGHSEPCVKDAVSLTDNALYILVKQRKKENPAPALIVNGNINDHNYKIIGQSYVWKSQRGNLCLDSIECLKGSISEPALEHILTAFANKSLKDNPDIKYVTIGCGGKTPKDLFSPALVSEKIHIGYQYEDSHNQYCIAKTSVDILNKHHREKWEHFLTAYPDPIKKVLDDFIFYLKDPDIFVSKLDNTDALIKQLELICSQDSELEYGLDRSLSPYTMADILKYRDLFSAQQMMAADQFIHVQEQQLEEACNHNDYRGVSFLLLFGCPITARVLKNIDLTEWGSRLLDTDHPILEKLQFVDGIHSLYDINKGKLFDLLLSSFIDEANNESHDVVTRDKLESFFKNKLHEIEQKDLNVSTSIDFKAKFSALKESYDPDKDPYAGPSIYEID